LISLFFVQIRGCSLIVAPFIFGSFTEQLYYIWYHYSIIELSLTFNEYSLALIFGSIVGIVVVARPGLEPGTQGFSGIK